MNSLKKVAPILVLISLVIFVFHNSLSFFFLLDDFGYLKDASNYVKYGDLLKYFSPYGGNHWFYRPLTADIFWFINYKLWGLNPTAFHLINLIVHIINTLLVYAILQQLGNRRLPSLAGAIFYGVNSSLFASVYWVCAISESGMAMFYLLSLLLFIRFLQTGSKLNYYLSFAMLIAALMSKESAITIPVIMMLTCLYLKPKVNLKEFFNAIRVTSPFILIVLAYLIMRIIIRGIPAEGIYHASFDVLAWVHNLCLYLIWGLGLEFLWGIPALVQSLSVDRSLTHIGLLIISISLIVWLLMIFKQRRTLLFSTLWFIVAILPALPFIHHAFDYYVNISIVGISILVASIFSDNRKLKTLLASSLLLIYVSNSIYCIHYKERYSVYAFGSSKAKTAVMDIKSMFPTLSKNAILYFINVHEDLYWCYSFGDIFKVYYENNSLITYFDGVDKIPSEFVPISDLHVVYQEQGHLYDVTNQIPQSKNVTENSKIKLPLVFPLHGKI